MINQQKIKRKLQRFAKKEYKRQVKYAAKVAKMSPHEREAELNRLQKKVGMLTKFINWLEKLRRKP